MHPQGLVDDLFSVLDYYDVDRCVVAGESMGALTVIEAVLRQPARFEGLVLVDGVTETSGQVTDHSAVRDGYDSYVPAFVDACIPEPGSEHLRQWGRQILMRADPDAAAGMLESHDVPRIAADLGAITIPTLVIHGRCDVIVAPSVGEAAAAAIQHAELVVIEDAGHVPTLTRPREVVAAITAWSARLPG